MARYLEDLERRLTDLDIPGQFYIMQSSGGIVLPREARRFPIRLVESGPAAGAIAAARAARDRGESRLLSFDMGGTTAKACVIDDGAPLVAREFEVARADRFKKGSGMPVRVPVIEMIEIGAGGGSISRVDRMGLLKVGPDSAGADPGPACYNLGGRLPTVTDADLLLGYLDAEFFLGGRSASCCHSAPAPSRRTACYRPHWRSTLSALTASVLTPPTGRRSTGSSPRWSRRDAPCWRAPA